jgi:hypothetical protein
MSMCNMDLTIYSVRLFSLSGCFQRMKQRSFSLSGSTIVTTETSQPCSPKLFQSEIMLQIKNLYIYLRKRKNL